MTIEKSKHGGSRPGAGRKPADDGGPRYRVISLRLSNDELVILDGLRRPMGEGREGRGVVLRRLLIEAVQNGE